MKSLSGITTAGALAAGIAIAFQNCSPVSFDAAPVPSEGPVAAGTPLPSTSEPPAPPPPVICDPFAPSSVCGDQGLVGSIYYLTSGQVDQYGSKVDDYIEHGHKIETMVMFTRIDIPQRNFSEGFPLPEGGQVQRIDGEPLIEWFALDLRGKIRVQTPYAEGDYQFALESDDGTILSVDGETLITNDGIHGPQWACSNRPVTLKASEPPSIRLKYFQGPRQYIALRFLWRPWAKRNEPCNGSGGFEPVPSAVLIPE